MLYVFNGDYERAIEKGAETFLISIAIILGFVVVTDIFKIKSRRDMMKREQAKKN